MKEFKINIQNREIIILQDDDGYFLKSEMIIDLEKYNITCRDEDGINI